MKILQSNRLYALKGPFISGRYIKKHTYLQNNFCIKFEFFHQLKMFQFVFLIYQVKILQILYEIRYLISYS